MTLTDRDRPEDKPLYTPPAILRTYTQEELRELQDQNLKSMGVLVHGGAHLESDCY